MSLFSSPKAPPPPASSSSWASLLPITVDKSSTTATSAATATNSMLPTWLRAAFTTSSHNSHNSAANSATNSTKGSPPTTTTNTPSTEDSMLDGWLSSGSGSSGSSWLPPLSRTQRLVGFSCCLLLSAFCFLLAYLLLPIVVLKSRKFALLFSLGSLFALLALAMLRGPATFAQHMLGRERWPLALLYLSSILLTLYCAMGLRRTLPTVAAAALEVWQPPAGSALALYHPASPHQVCMLAFFMSSYVPGGLTGLKLLLKVGHGMQSMSAPHFSYSLHTHIHKQLSFYTTKSVLFPAAKAVLRI